MTRKIAQSSLLGPEWFELEKSGPGKPDGPEELFASQCRAYHLPRFERQVVFAKEAIGRLWRFDFAFRDYMVAVEIEGLVVQRLAGQIVLRGRHGTIGGIIEDMDKYNTAAMLGWTVLRYPQKYVKPKNAIEMTMRVLAARGWKQTHEQ